METKSADVANAKPLWVPPLPMTSDRELRIQCMNAACHSQAADPMHVATWFYQWIRSEPK